MQKLDAHHKQTKIRFNRLMSSFKNLFYYGCQVDAWMPEIILLPFVSLQWKTDPTWYRMIAPPGSGKSQHLILLEDFELTYTIDEFTPKSFVSGFRGMGDSDPSKLPQFDGKVLIISDETTLMEQRQEDRNMVQSILRKAYDGKFSKSFGNIKEKQEYSSHFNLLIGSTPSIDRYFSYAQALGERYINFRAQVPDRKALATASFMNQFRDYKSEHKKLSLQVHDFIRKLPEVGMSDIYLSVAMQNMLIECADLVALIRTHINRDSSGRHVTTLPQAESAGRLVKQLTQTALSNAIIRGDNTVGIEHLQKAVYLGLGSIMAVTIFILFNIWNFTREPGRTGDTVWFSVQELVIRTALSRSTIAQQLEDLAIHRILDIRQGKKQGGRLIEYRLNQEMQEILRKLKFFTYYKPPMSEILSITKLDHFIGGEKKINSEPRRTIIKAKCGKKL